MTKKLFTNPNPKQRTLDSFKQRLLDDPTDENAQHMIDFYTSFEENKRNEEKLPKWQENNLEYDLRTSEYIRNKCLNSEPYAQNLYAALCNNEFRKNDVIPILKEETWGCSWRYAGGIIADILERGDYMDWYCSGIRGEESTDTEYVTESVVTDEIRNDLLQLNWLVIVDNEQKW